MSNILSTGEAACGLVSPNLIKTESAFWIFVSVLYCGRLVGEKQREREWRGRGGSLGGLEHQFRCVCAQRREKQPQRPRGDNGFFWAEYIHWRTNAGEMGVGCLWLIGWRALSGVTRATWGSIFMLENKFSSIGKACDLWWQITPDGILIYLHTCR